MENSTQLPGVPEEYELVRWGAPKKDEKYITPSGVIAIADYHYEDQRLIVRKRRWRPERGGFYWTPCFSDDDLAYEYSWDSTSSFDRNLLNAGLVFETKEEASNAARRMLKALESGEE